MFQSEFQQTSSTPLPPNLSVEQGVEILHNFEAVIRLSPDCRGCKPIPPPNGKKQPAAADGSTRQEQLQYYEVEDDLPFIPKRLWNGGVKYTADFLPTADGCDITVYAPGGFTSTNHWRLLREAVPDDSAPAQLDSAQKSRDQLHADTAGGTAGWYVQIISDARCNITFAGFVKGFLRNSQLQLQHAFIEKLKSTPAEQRSRRPTLGRRRSSVF